MRLSISYAQELSVTKSLVSGNACIGLIRTGSPSGVSSRTSSTLVMHINFGLPLTSAPHEPHLPALQFQRHARSGDCSACIR